MAEPSPDLGPVVGAVSEQPQHHFLVQAPVPAIDADGVAVVSVGTVLFAVASIVLALLRPELAAQGRGWWLPVCLSGFGLGLVGLLYCRRLARRRRRDRG
ncbi:DUF2530 domain-containing protein [uncultured Friedmanniella sp.]|uniref:DUF2530 domain-containing protein n=1 Tax=uncultured Friedmanniella sp. TaxID=335381 RepID=UPI0035CA91B8